MDLEEKALSVTQDNQLLEASYTLTLNQKRLLLLGISKLDPRSFPKSGAEFDVSAEEWGKHYPQDENPWRALKQASKGMLRRHVTIHPKKGAVMDMNWIESILYVEQEARVKVKFTYSITVRLQGLIDQFTSINLLSVAKFNSFYSIRLYELLSQFRATGYRRISLQDFRVAMNCVDSYKQTKELRRWVLNPAMKELQEKADFDVEHRDIKAGRKITGFEFILAERTQGDLFK